MTSEGTQSIVVEWQLPQAPAKVWRALTEPALIARWLMENDFRPVVGHQFTMRAQPMPGWDGVVRCEVLELVEGERLRYSWRGGQLDTVVTWDLAPSAAGGTTLRLEHAGFLPRDQFALDGLGKGWRGRVGERLAQIAAEA